MQGAANHLQCDRKRFRCRHMRSDWHCAASCANLGALPEKSIKEKTRMRKLIFPGRLLRACGRSG